MDASTIQQLIGTLGFPIAMTAAMFWYMVTEGKATREAIQNNTLALTKLIEENSKRE